MPVGRLREVYRWPGVGTAVLALGSGGPPSLVTGGPPAPGVWWPSFLGDRGPSCTWGLVVDDLGPDLPW